MKFSIIIPTYGNAQLVSNCISSLKRVEPDTNKYEIIVVDDGSPDQAEIDKLTDENTVTAIFNNPNQGFSSAVNLGIGDAKNEIIVLVNNDIIFTQPFLNAYKDIFLNKPDVGIVGALLAYPNQTVQHAGLTYDSHNKQFLHAFKNKPIANPDTQVKAPYYAIAVTGALFAFRKELISSVGVFDEDYFVACEDTDYCLRAWEKGWKVLYTPKVFALHLEGATRGNTDNSKALKGPDWAKKEKAAIERFKSKLDSKLIADLAQEIAELNNPPLKLEIGSGYNPQPGYIHLEIRADLPDVDVVCDIQKQKLPYANNTISEILANHVIEHISFRKLPFVIREWERVLKPDGKLVLRTPNLRFIMGHYACGNTTPEWPGDEQFIRDNFGEVTPAWWANLKLFSGQDYDANFHHVCFDFPMLRGLLERYGFEEVKEEKFDKEYSPGELQVTARKKIKRKTIILSRQGALGDVLLTTPITRRLKAEGYDVIVGTDCPEAYYNNTDVKKLIKWNTSYSSEHRDRLEDLDGCYETLPARHIIDAYSLQVFEDTKTPHEIVYNVSEKSLEKMRNLVTKDYVAIHAAQSWENRTWKKSYWYELILELFDIHNTKVVVVGSKKDATFPAEARVLDTVGKFSLDETAAIIKLSKAFIGTDSALLHIAQAVKTPSIGIFTCAKAEYRTTGALAVVPDIDCYGCLADEPTPATYCGCRRGDFKCLEIITPEMVLEKYKELNV